MEGTANRVPFHDGRLGPDEDGDHSMGAAVDGGRGDTMGAPEHRPSRVQLGPLVVAICPGL